MLKDLFVHEIFKFLCWLFGHVEKRLDKKGYFQNLWCHIQDHAENDARRLAPDLLLFLEKALHKVKASGQHFSFNIFW